MAQPRPPSPSASLQSTHSFLDEDPYPSGVRRPLSSLSPNNLHNTPSSQSDDALTNSALLNRLESLLRAKAEEVQLAGQLGQALLEQQNELELRIREIAEVSDRYAKSTPSRSSNAEGEESSDGEREIGEETRQKLRELEQDLVGYEGQNSGLYQVVGEAAQRGVPTVEDLSKSAIDPDYSSSTSPSTTFDSPQNASGAFEDPSAPAPTSVRRRAPSLSGSSKRPDLSSLVPNSTDSTDPASSRRARNNAQHRNNDLELATDIGQSLLIEVRRLQALLQEKDEHLQSSIKEKDSMAIEVESAMQARKTVEESVGKSTFSLNFSLPIPALTLDLLRQNDTRKSIGNSNSLHKIFATRYRPLNPLFKKPKSIDQGSRKISPLPETRSKPNESNPRSSLNKSRRSKRNTKPIWPTCERTLLDSNATRVTFSQPSKDSSRSWLRKLERFDEDLLHLELQVIEDQVKTDSTMKIQMDSVIKLKTTSSRALNDARLEKDSLLPQDTARICSVKAILQLLLRFNDLVSLLRTKSTDYERTSLTLNVNSIPYERTSRGRNKQRWN